MTPNTITTGTAAPRLNVTDPSFSITSAEVHGAREASWFAHTEYGIAVLRYNEVSQEAGQAASA